ncbi:hypothetical protein NXH76_20540 [Blautia schinkii]|nr:hypothetical protein [Blautia schinkii]
MYIEEGKERVVICPKCGMVSTEDMFLEGAKCYDCNEGIPIPIDLTWDEMYAKYYSEVEEKTGRYPTDGEVNEAIRKDYFYGKMDQDLDSKCLEIRKYKDTPEYIAECRDAANAAYYARQNGTSCSGPKCPSCGSTNLTRLSAVGKVARVGLFGRLGTGNLGKTYKCNNCGVKF